jgi:hypothetical protein
MFITVVVSFSWEVDPFWMTKFVTHEVKIGLSTKRLRQESNHFVEGHSPVDCQSPLIIFTHSCIDFSIKQPHRNSLVTYNCLIMGLTVSNNLLIPSSIGQTMSDMAHAPVFIWALLEHLDPHIWHEHAQPVVKPHSTIFKFSA